MGDAASSAPAPAATAASLVPPDLQVLFNHLADAVYLIDPDSSSILWGNRQAWAMLGLAADAVIEHSVLSLQKDVTGRPQWAEIAAVVRQQPDGYTFVGRHRHARGHEVAVEVLTSCFSHGGREYFLSVARDVSRRVALQAGLASREDQLRFALNESADGLWDWDVPAGTVYFSPQLKRMLGYGPDEMTPALVTWTRAVHVEDHDRVLAALQAHLDGQSARYEAQYRLRSRNGDFLWVQDRGKVCARDAQGQAVRVVGMVQDITAHKELELQLQHLAAHDALTGLANRREGVAMLEAHVRRCAVGGGLFSICLLDIDYFKRVNDSMGHAAGDAGLCMVAQAITQTVRRTSDFVCRWGGEEFLVVLPSADADQAGRIANHVREAVASQGAHSVMPLTVSVGTATYPMHGGSADALLATADAALYRAKRGGRNRVESGE